jgi:DNA-binding NarL/FixJ family response regulator
VDDHVPTTRLVIDLLRVAFPGLAFASVLTAAEAIASCAASPPRLVIMDIRLPDLSGIDAVRRIKSLSTIVKVVMHSNHDHSVYQEESAAAGADAFVSKSRTFAELVPAVARLLNLQSQSEAEDTEREQR